MYKNKRIFALDFYTFSSLRVRSSNLSWQSSWFANANYKRQTIPLVDPTVDIFYGVGSACHRATYHHKREQLEYACWLFISLDIGTWNKCEHVWWSNAACKLLNCVLGQDFYSFFLVYFCLRCCDLRWGELKRRVVQCATLVWASVWKPICTVAWLCEPCTNPISVPARLPSLMQPRGRGRRMTPMVAG